MFGIGEKIYNFVLYLKRKMTRNRKPKKNPSYMLFIYGDFSESENLIQELSGQMLTLVSSPFLKYTYGEFGVVFHFRSNELFSELKEYVDMVLNDITEQYFLIETTANGVDIKMAKKLKKDFLNVDDDAKKEETKTGEINIESKLNERREELRNFTFEFLMPEDLSSILQTDTEYKVVEPTVDEILEKITEEGIESLTETEKEILDNYGKRKNGGN
tara:strand:+ start:239 stop:886 length:648 start_codon:yes stop_codon:yes gene_type:complete